MCSINVQFFKERSFGTSYTPHARAVDNFQVCISRGKFQGMIWPQTPTGSCLKGFQVFLFQLFLCECESDIKAKRSVVSMSCLVMEK